MKNSLRITTQFTKLDSRKELFCLVLLYEDVLVPLGLEPRITDSKSAVLTATLWDQCKFFINECLQTQVVPTGIEPVSSPCKGLVLTATPWNQKGSVSALILPKD